MAKKFDSLRRVLDTRLAEHPDGDQIRQRNRDALGDAETSGRPGETRTIKLSAGERRRLIDHALLEAGELGENLDRASADRVALVRGMHAQLGRIVGLLDDLERDDVPATTDLRALADALRRDAIDAAAAVDDPADVLAHRDRLACADAVLARLETC
jgi:hypothetical protein